MKKQVISLIIALALCVLAFVSCQVGTGGSGTGGSGEGGIDGAGQGGESGGESGGDKAPESYIYKSDTPLAIVVDEELLNSNAFTNLYSALSSKLDSYPVILSEGEAAYEHEIVIGNQNRPITTEALDRLGRYRPEVDGDELKYHTRYLIYSDGSSLAVVFDKDSDDVAAFSALEAITDNYVRDILSLPVGTVKRESVNILEYRESVDEKFLEEKWAVLAGSAGENGAEIAEALKYYYGNYTDELITWLANLWEPEVCACEGGVCRGSIYCGGGAFYYSNSARDNVGYLPDVESTAQALGFLNSSGMLHAEGGAYQYALPEEMKQSLIVYVKGLQQENGNFYHPQWGTNVGSSRIGRDRSRSSGILTALGAKPTYDIPSLDVKGDGLLPDGTPLNPTAFGLPIGESAVTAVARVIAANEQEPPAYLKDEESFLSYLNKLDMRNNSYAAGNTLGSIMSEITYWSRKYQEKTGVSLVKDVLVPYMNSCQNPARGSWYWVDPSNPSFDPYYEVNGIMKITGVYISCWTELPNLEKTLETAMGAITNPTEPSAIVDVYNPWFAITNIYSILRNVGGRAGAEAINACREELLSKAPELIRATADKIAFFRRMDGSFSYGRKYSSATSQGVPAAVPNTEEGDVNGMVMAVTGTTELMYEALGLTFYKVPIYTDEDWEEFISIVMGLDHVIKNEVSLNVSDVKDTEAMGTGKYKDLSYDFEKQTAGDLEKAGVFSTDKPDKLYFQTLSTQNFVTSQETELGRIMAFQKKQEGDPYFRIRSQSTDYKSYVFEADFCLLGGTTKQSDGGVFFFYPSYGEENKIWWAGQTALSKADNDPDGNAQYRVSRGFDRYLKAGYWYNIRFEYQDVTTVGSEIRMYIDNALVAKSKTTDRVSGIDYMLLRFRMDSGTDSVALFDNIYFSSVEYLAPDDSEIIPPVNVTKGENTDGDTYRASGTLYGKGVEYTKTNVTLLDKAGVISTNGLTYDPSVVSGLNYLRIQSVDGDEALVMGKNSNGSDPYLIIPETELRSGTSYVFETDFALMKGSDKRADDDVVLEAFATKGGTASSDFFWNGSWNITQTEGEYFFNMGLKNTEGEALSYKITSKLWYNLRIEYSDTSKSGSEIRVYLNGTLIHTGITTASAAKLSAQLIRFKLATNDGLLYLDNTYFGATGEEREPEPELPEEPDVPVTPSYPEISAQNSRGTGVFYNNAATLGFADTTATALGEAGKLVLSGTNDVAIDGENMFVKVADLGGDNALVVGNNQHAKQAYLNIPASSTGEHMTLELDLMLDSSVASCNSSRSGLEIFQIMDGSSASATLWLMSSINIYEEDAGFSIIIGKERFTLKEGQWINIRVEFDSTSSGTAITFYLNGERVSVGVSAKNLSDLKFLRVWSPLNATGTLNLDNIYLGVNPNPTTVPEEPDPEQPVDPDPEEPVDPDPEEPAEEETDPAVTGRGKGVYYERSERFTAMTSIPDTSSTYGSVVLTKAPTKNSITVSTVDKNLAMVISRTAADEENRFNIIRQGSGSSMVLEMDLKLSGLVQKANRGFTLGATTSATGNHDLWGNHPVKIIWDDALAKNVLTVAGVVYEFTEGEWFNLRVEYTGLTENSVVKVYINGVKLEADGTLTKSIASAKAFNAYALANGTDSGVWRQGITGTISIDNIYLGDLIEVTEPEQPVDPDPEQPVDPDPEQPVEPDPEEPVDPDPEQPAETESARVLETLTGADGIAVFMHDDGSTASMLILDELFRYYGLKGNIALLANKIYDPQAGSYKESEVASWARYFGNGRWQLSSHSMTHEFWGISNEAETVTYTDDSGNEVTLTFEAGRITVEVADSRTVLRTAFPNQRVLTFAYPGFYAQRSLGTDRFSAVSRALVNSTYIAGRDSYGETKIDLDGKTSWEFAPSYQLSSSNVDEILTLLGGIGKGEMAVIYTHMITPNTTATLPSNTIYEKDMAAVAAKMAELQSKGKLWVTFYEDAVLYTRERQASTVTAVTEGEAVTVTLSLDSSLDPEIYNYPLAVRVKLPSAFEAVRVVQGDSVAYYPTKLIGDATYADVVLIPNGTSATVTSALLSDIPSDNTELPADNGNRGNGEYADEALDFTDKTAADLKEEGALSSDGNISFDAFGHGVIVDDYNGNAALRLGNNFWDEQGYLHILSQNGGGRSFVFETDLLVVSCGSGRSDNVFLQLMGLQNTATTAWNVNATAVANDDGTLTLSVAGEKLSAEYGRWYNLRIEIDDAPAGGEVRYYVDGVLVFTKTSSSAVSNMTGVRIWFAPTSNGVVWFDNVYFGCTDPEQPEDPENPGEGGETEPTVTNRGSGVYYNNADTLGFEDTTAATLGEAGSFIAGGTTVNLGVDSTKIHAEVVDKDGNSALMLANCQYAKEAYLTLAPSSTGGALVFEADILVEGTDNLSFSSGRSDKYVFQFFSGSSAGATVWKGSPNGGITKETDDAGNVVYFLKLGTAKEQIALGEWVNLRIEYTGFASGSVQSIYINGTLAGTATLSGAVTTASIRIWCNPDAQGIMYLDNVYLGTPAEAAEPTDNQ